MEEHTESTQGGYVSTESELTTEQHRAAAGPPDARTSGRDERAATHRASEPELEDELGETGA